MKLHPFLKQAAGVGGINLADRVLAVVLGVVLARWLGVEQYGIYALVMAMVSLLLLLVRAGVPNLVMREVSASRAHNPTAIASKLIRRAETVVFFWGILVMLAADLVVMVIVQSPETRQAFFIGLLLLPLLALQDIRAYSLRALGWVRTAQALVVLVPTILVLAITSGVALLFPGLAPGALAARLGGVVVAAFFLLVVARRVFGRFEPVSNSFETSYRVMVRGAFPFMLISAAAVIMARTDVVMLGVLAGTRDVGLYNAALQGALLVSLILNTSNTIVAPEFARLYAAGNREALQRYAVFTARSVALVALPVMAGLVVFGGSLLGLLFGTEFQEGATALSILAVGYYTSLLFGAPGFLLNMTGHEKVAFRVVLTSTVLNIILNALLIPIFGMIGAALATSLALNVQKALAAWFAYRALGVVTVCFSGRGNSQ